MKIFLRLFIFHDIAYEDSQDLRDDWQEHHNLDRAWKSINCDTKQKHHLNIIF